VYCPFLYFLSFSGFFLAFLVHSVSFFYCFHEININQSIYSIGVFKQTFSRCLTVMVSMGYGMSCDTLTVKARTAIFGLGSVDAFTSCLYDFLLAFAAKKVNKLSIHHSNAVLHTASFLINVRRVADAYFLMLVMTSLTSTIEYFQGVQQKSGRR
jgi:Lung seven transmembrane receptor